MHNQWIFVSGILLVTCTCSFVRSQCLGSSWKVSEAMGSHPTRQLERNFGWDPESCWMTLEPMIWFIRWLKWLTRVPVRLFETRCMFFTMFHHVSAVILRCSQFCPNLLSYFKSLLSKAVKIEWTVEIWSDRHHPRASCHVPPQSHLRWTWGTRGAWGCSVMAMAAMAVLKYSAVRVVKCWELLIPSLISTARWKHRWIDLLSSFGPCSTTTSDRSEPFADRLGVLSWGAISHRQVQ